MNYDIKTRDEIIFGNYDANAYIGGIRRFRTLTADALKVLLDKEFAEADESHNNAPSIREMYEFGVKHPGFVFDGYAVSDKRSDYRVSIDGLHYVENEMSLSIAIDFADMFRFADEFDFAKGCAWYD